MPSCISFVLSPKRKRAKSGCESEVTKILAVLPFNNLFHPNPPGRNLYAKPGSHARSKSPFKSAGIVDHHDG